MQNNYILAGDIGGTKTILALAEAGSRDMEFLHLKRYDSGAYSSLEAMIKQFFTEVTLSQGQTLASFGIAGAVKDGRCQTTNLPWIVDEKKVESTLGLKKVTLINDFTAATMGIPFLSDSDVEILNEGNKEKKGPIAVLGAGTGLGEGAAFYSESDDAYKVISSEGGHTTFSPTTHEEIELLKYLMIKFGHVSFERLLSGQGLINIYDFLSHTMVDKVNDPVAHEMKNNNSAAVITKHALAGSDELSERALLLFLSIYGSEAGNVALKFLPYGGLYIGGGIAPKIAGKFRDGVFMKAFFNKGRMAQMLSRIPVALVLKEELGLIGALVRGRELIKKYE